MTDSYFAVAFLLGNANKRKKVAGELNHWREILNNENNRHIQVNKLSICI